MKKTITLENLKAERKALKEELETLERLITIRERKEKRKTHGSEFTAVPYPRSIRDDIVTTVYNLVRENGGCPVTSSQIFERVDKLHILDKVKNKQATLSAVLDQVSKKKNPQLYRVERGVFDIVNSKPATFTQTVRDPNTGKLVHSEAEFEKPKK